MSLTLLATFWWMLVPPALVLGIMAFLFLFYKGNEIKTQATETIADTVNDATTEVVDSLSKVHRAIQALAVYQPRNRGEALVMDALGASYTSLRLSEKQFVASALVAALIEAGWEVLREQQIPEYDGQRQYLVCSKDHDADGLPETIVLELKLTDVHTENVTAKGTFDASSFAIDGRIMITEGVTMSAIECAADCGVEMVLLVKRLATSSEVTVSYYRPQSPDRVDIMVYSKSASDFVKDTIYIKPTPANVLSLSYNAHRRGSDSKISTQSYPLSVAKMIRVMVQTTSPKDEAGNKLPGKRLNLALVGPANTGKSHLLRALVAAAAAEGINIIKANAASFATFKNDDAVLASLKARAVNQPTWLIIDEANGLPEDLVASLASLMEGLDSVSTLSVILATNNEADITAEATANLFRGGRIDLFVKLAKLPFTMWNPLFEELKALSPTLKWTKPENPEKMELALGEVYQLGQSRDFEDIFQELRV